MAKAKKKGIRLNRHFGKNAPEMISELVITSAYAGIVELCVNSYDADATVVRIEYMPHTSQGGFLKITDNGWGMSPEDLVGFYRLGDSPKLKQRVSPDGRKCIGKFGIATILLKFLAKKYTLRTQKDCLETRVEEEFKGKLKANTEIPHTTKKLKEDEETIGTEIILKGLNFGEETGFTLKELRKRLRWDLPQILPDWQIYVDGEAIQPRLIKNAVEFKIDKKWKHLGHLHGSLYLTGKSSNQAGIYVYVNERKVGDPQSLLTVSRVDLAKRIIGILHADDLEEAILFDRGKFREDHPGYRQLREVVKQAIGKMRSYNEVRTIANRKEKIQGKIPSFLNKLKKRCLDAKIREVNKDTEFSLTDKLPKRKIGQYDESSKTFLLNEGHAALYIPKGTTDSQYEAAILNAFVDTLTEMRVDKKSKVSWKDFLHEKERVWRQLNFLDDTTDLQERIHPMIFYSWKDISKQTGRSQAEFQYFRKEGVLPKNLEGVLGQDYLDLAKKTEGMVSLYSILEDIWGSYVGWSIYGASEALIEAGKLALPFTKNVGTKTNPCIFVESACAKDMSELVEDDECRKIARSRLETWHNSYYSIPELAKTIDSDARQVSKILDYAKKNSIEIRQEKGKRTVKFNYADFITTVQVMRKPA